MTDIASPVRRQTAWRLLAVLGLLMLVHGLLDAWQMATPLRLGQPEWEFGTVSALFDRFALIAIGLAFLMTAAAAGGKVWPVRMLALAGAVIAVVLWVSAVLYLTTLPMVLNAVTDPDALLPIKKAMLKTAIQAAVYPVALIWVGAAAWKRTPAVRK